MHLTDIVLKDGRSLRGVIMHQRFDPVVFEHSYLEIYDGEGYAMLYLKDIVSAVTRGERISIHRIGDLDELARLRNLWEQFSAGQLRGLSLVEPEYRLPPGALENEIKKDI